MAAQNIGAGRRDRARKTMHKGILLALPIGLVFCFIAFIAPQSIIGIFTNNQDVIHEGVEYIRFFSLDYIIVAFLFCINGLLMGAGMTTFTMVNSILTSMVLRIPVAYLLGMVFNMGLTGIGLAAPVASIGGLIISFCFYKSGKWTKKEMVQEPILLDDMA